MKLAIAQFNCVLGDLAGNAAKISQYAEQARMQGAQLLLTPELGLCGYPPEDLLLRDGFYHACAQALHDLAAKIPDIAVVVGHPLERDGKRYNAATLLRNGIIAATYLKRELPNYSVFDEERYFDHGTESCLFEIAGVRLVSRRARLHRQEPLPRRVAGIVGRDRFRIDPGDRGGRAGCGQGSCGDDAVAVYRADQPRRFARNGEDPRRAL